MTSSPIALEFHDLDQKHAVVGGLENNVSIDALESVRYDSPRIHGSDTET
jgi:hypothetical protein